MAFPNLARAGLAAHPVRRLYLFWSDRPDAWVDITATFDRKVRALRSHESQLRDADGLTDRMRAWAKDEGASIDVSAAEALRLIVIDDDEVEGPDPA
jgi:LmbE family N-acetylglucosaminyl deacetylase